ncbi:MAG: bifunctional serine/threonine-protein kinase/formylglycine-generating enzyme family protein [Planctomycetota bacterium]
MGNPSEGNATSLRGLLLLDRYRVEQRIGAGGMGQVWVAMDEVLERRVVVKVPHADFVAEPGFAQRFEREIEGLLALDHPHILKILARGIHAGVPFLIASYMEGGSLQDRITATETGQLPLSRLLEWLPDIARALDFVHSRGVVHRDVKPENILFDQSGHAFLADFGLVKSILSMTSGLTQTGATPGSPIYMAPEQSSSEPLTGATDQYALAVTIYRALSGSLPFEGKTPVEVLIRKRTEDPRPIVEVAPHLSAAQARAIMQALSRDPTERHPTCGQFIQHLGMGSSTEDGVPAQAPSGAGQQSDRGDPDEAGASRLQQLASSPAQSDALATPTAQSATPRRGVRRAVFSLTVVGLVAASVLLTFNALTGSGRRQVGQVPSQDGGTGSSGTEQPSGAMADWAGQPPATIPIDAAWAISSEAQLHAASDYGVPVAFENEIGMRFMLIPPGEFTMGSSGSEVDDVVREARLGGLSLTRSTFESEIPAHTVRITKPFYMQVTEVTNGQWRKYDPSHKSGSAGRHTLDAEAQPATSVRYVDVAGKDGAYGDGFIAWLRARSDNLAPRGILYRLPSEAEWEYAARAGTTGSRYWGVATRDVARFENVCDRAFVRERGEWRGAPFDADDGHIVAAPVGSFQPNGFGLYDMLGNVAEWCADWYDGDAENYYERSPAIDPPGATRGTGRVVRGGSWMSVPYMTRCASRDGLGPEGNNSSLTLGVRVAASLPAR